MPQLLNSINRCLSLAKKVLAKARYNLVGCPIWPVLRIIMLCYSLRQPIGRSGKECASRARQFTCFPIYPLTGCILRLFYFHNYRGHGCPTVAVPVTLQILHSLRQAVQDAVLSPARADRVNGDAPIGQGYIQENNVVIISESIFI